MNYLISIIFLCSGMITNAQITIHTYDLKISGNAVDTLPVTENKQINQEEYSSGSECIVHLFGKTAIKRHQEATYVNGTLMRSINQLWKDGSIDDETQVEINNSEYTITRNGTSSTLNQVIDYSALNLYFQISETVKAFFSETEGVFKSTVSLGNEIYQLSDNANHINKYTYNNGVMEGAVINHIIADALLILKY